MRRCLEHAPNADPYAFKRECLTEFEQLWEPGHIDPFYGDESGDESGVSLLPRVPSAWQSAEEQVVVPGERGGSVNRFALLPRDNRLHRYLTEQTITAAWISGRLDAFSLSLSRRTVLVLDNASVHRKAVKERGAVWQERGGSAAVPWRFCGGSVEVLRRFRGGSAAVPWRFCGGSVEVLRRFRGGSAAVPWRFCGGSAARTQV